MSPKLPFAIAGGDMYLERGIKPTPDQVVEFLTAAQKTPDLQGVLMWSADQNETTPELWQAFANYHWGPNLANEIGAFLDQAKASALSKGAYYQQVYEETRAGKQLDLNGRDPIEAAVCAGIKALAK